MIAEGPLGPGSERRRENPGRDLLSRLSGTMLAAAVAVLLILGTGAAQFAQAQVETVLHSFTYSTGDGGWPGGGSMVRDSSGNLYGTSEHGGSNDDGSVFEMVYDSSAHTYTEKVLYSFSGIDGHYPFGGLTLDSSGNLYGATAYGGSSGHGNVFELSPPATSGGNWTEKVLYNFSGADGDEPWGELTLDSSGNLYGTTHQGGSTYSSSSHGDGTVFELSPDSSTATGYSEKVLYSFSGADGDGPWGRLAMDASGDFYGTTYNGGSNSYGAVFELVYDSSTQSYTEEVLQNFAGGTGDGAYPYGGLIRDSSGNLYGTTADGGSSSDGTVFELHPDSSAATGYSEKLLYSFSGTDGAYPVASLIRDSAGNLYGTTNKGGSSDEGTVFELVYDSSTQSYSEKVLYSFTGGTSDGYYPYEGLVMDSSGNLYGTTDDGGSEDDGTVFGITPVTLSASSISFGNVAVGSTSAVQTETVTNIGGGKFSYGAASISGADAADFSVTNGCSTAVGPNGTCPVTLAFTPSTTTAEAATLNLSQNGLTQTVSLTGTGVYPTASLSASGLSFPSQDVGTTSSAQTVTLTNSSAVPLTVTSVGVTGDFAIASNNCNTVAPSGACTVGVTFSPTAGGKLTGTLSFTDNASNSPQSVALSGQGADFTLSPRTVSEAVPPGGYSSFDLLLSPEGGFNRSISLACSGAPKGAKCTVTPASVTLNGINSASFGVKVTTTGSAMLAPGPGNYTPPSGSLPMAAWLSLFGLLGLLALAKLSPRGGRIRRLAPLATLALLITFSVACGGGSSGMSTTNSNTTPAGTYTLTVTGTSGSLTQTAQVALKVQ